MKTQENLTLTLMRITGCMNFSCFAEDITCGTLLVGLPGVVCLIARKYC